MSVIPPELVVLLDECGTKESAHSAGTLREHLSGTHDLLKAWGNPDHVVLAGLFHSIYGTQYFKVQSAQSSYRSRIQQGIGDEAENLAYLFCTVDRMGLAFELDKPEPRLWDVFGECFVSVSPIVLQELVEIDVANSVEQYQRAKPMSPAQLSHFKQKYARCEPYVTSKAQQAFERMLSCQDVAVAV
ncbi:MAG: DUF6817 domain-containing protein [Gammaproteobacteria bacterium]